MSWLHYFIYTFTCDISNELCHIWWLFSRIKLISITHRNSSVGHLPIMFLNFTNLNKAISYEIGEMMSSAKDTTTMVSRVIPPLQFKSCSMFFSMCNVCSIISQNYEKFQKKRKLSIKNSLWINNHFMHHAIMYAIGFLFLFRSFIGHYKSLYFLLINSF